MAKLIAPKIGYQLRLASGKKSKVHLAKAGSLDETVCKFLLHDDATKVKLSEVSAADICQKCLGAIRCED